MVGQCKMFRLVLRLDQHHMEDTLHPIWNTLQQHRFQQDMYVYQLMELCSHRMASKYHLPTLCLFHGMLQARTSSHLLRALKSVGMLRSVHLGSLDLQHKCYSH